MVYYPCSSCSGTGFVAGARGGGGVYSSEFCTACGGTGSEYSTNASVEAEPGYYRAQVREFKPDLDEIGPVPDGDPDDPSYRDAVVRWFHFTQGDYAHRLLLTLQHREPQRFKKAIRSIRDGRAADVRAYLSVWYTGKDRRSQ